MEQRKFLEWINSEGKLSALQNFTDAVCAAQRENCADEYSDWDGEPCYQGILNAEQPKIDEL